VENSRRSPQAARRTRSRQACATIPCHPVSATPIEPKIARLEARHFRAIVDSHFSTITDSNSTIVVNPKIATRFTPKFVDAIADNPLTRGGRRFPSDAARRAGRLLSDESERGIRMKLGNHWVVWAMGIAAASAGGCALDTTSEEAKGAVEEESSDQGGTIDSQEQAASAFGAYGWVAGNRFGGIAPDHVFNSSGNAVTSTRTSQGNYTVTFHGLQSKIPSGSGYPMVTGRGAEATRCKIRDWRRHTNSMQVDVRCNNTAGTAWDADFFASVYDRSTNFDTGAYAVVILSTNSPAIDTPRSWTSGGAMSVQRQQAGLYRVFMPGASRGEGAALVSAIQNNGNHCKVHDLIAGLTDATVQVACYNSTGTRVDESFVVDFIGAHGRTPGVNAFIHTLSSNGATAPNKTGAYSDMEGTVSSARPNAATPWASFWATGSYTTWFPRIRPFNKTYWHVTATGTDSTFCKPALFPASTDGATPTGTKIDVYCFNNSGTLTNGRYFHYMGFDLANPPI
jgi:hypothetical protein